MHRDLLSNILSVLTKRIQKFQTWFLTREWRKWWHCLLRSWRNWKIRWRRFDDFDFDDDDDDIDDFDFDDDDDEDVILFEGTVGDLDEESQESIKLAVNDNLADDVYVGREQDEEKSLNQKVMEKFNLTMDDWEQLSYEDRQKLRDVYKNLDWTKFGENPVNEKFSFMTDDIFPILALTSIGENFLSHIDCKIINSRMMMQGVDDADALNQSYRRSKSTI